METEEAFIFFRPGKQEKWVQMKRKRERKQKSVGEYNRVSCVVDLFVYKRRKKCLCRVVI